MTSTASVGSKAHGRQGRSGRAVEIENDDGILADPERPGLVPEGELGQEQGYRQRHDQHRHDREDEQPEGAQKDPPLRFERDGGAVLEELEGQQMGVDVVSNALDRPLVGRVLEDGEQQHARHCAGERGGEPARQGSDRGQQQPPESIRDGAQPEGGLCKDDRSFDISQAAKLVRDLAFLLPRS